VKDAADVLLMGTRAVDGLASGASSPGSRRVTVPLSTQLGTYRVLACADDTSKVAESDNVNNCRASTTTITVH
jgi:subtilase family serine protease